MAGITLAQAEAKLTTWLDAEDSLATAQAYTMPDGRMLTRANLKDVRAAVEAWDKRVKRLTRGGINLQHGTPA